MTEIGEEFVRSELNIIPAQVFVIDIYRKVYKCKHCSDDEKTNIFKAHTPVPAIKKSKATAATIAYVMQQKYQLGLPLYRMEQYWKAEGVNLLRNTLANWIIQGSLWFRPLWERMLHILLTENIINADETELRVLKRDGHQVDSVSRMWVFCSGSRSKHKMSIYFYHPTRSGKVVERILGNYSGYLQTDGYSAYNAAVNVAERAIKPFVMGRKNWLFSDTDKGADASARCYSIIESAKLNNLNVFAYLSHLLTELPKLGKEPYVEQVDKLLPWSDALPEFCKNLSAKEKSNDEQKEKC